MNHSNSSFACGSCVLIAYIGEAPWRATVLECNASVPSFETLTVRDAEGRFWGFYSHRKKWYSAFGRRQVLIGAVEREKVSA